MIQHIKIETDKCPPIDTKYLKISETSAKIRKEEVQKRNKRMRRKIKTRRNKKRKKKEKKK